MGDARVRSLVQRLPRVIPSQAIPRVRIADVPPEVAGYWSLWRIALAADEMRDAKVLPLFHHDDGRVLLPTARLIWDSLLEERPRVELLGYLAGEEAEEVYRRLRAEAESQGQAYFDELHGKHHQRATREQEKGQYAFRVRRDALNRIGLPEVRQHRLRRMDEEERAWADELLKRQQILPELHPIVILRMEATNG